MTSAIVTSSYFKRTHILYETHKVIQEYFVHQFIYIFISFHYYENNNSFLYYVNFCAHSEAQGKITRSQTVTDHDHTDD